MNFDKDDLAGSIVMRDRQRIGASLADIDPMTVDRSVSNLMVLPFTLRKNSNWYNAVL